MSHPQLNGLDPKTSKLTVTSKSILTRIFFIEYYDLFSEHPRLDL